MIPSRLQEALPDDTDVTFLIGAAYNLVQAGLREQVIGSVVRRDDRHLHDYLRSVLGNARQERFVVVYFGPCSIYIADEIVGAGSISEVQVCLRSLIRRALDLGAKELLLAHNHPSGDPQPSEADKSGTIEIAKVASALNIRLMDHLILTAQEVYSMRQGISL